MQCNRILKSQAVILGFSVGPFKSAVSTIFCLAVLVNKGVLHPPSTLSPGLLLSVAQYTKPVQRNWILKSQAVILGFSVGLSKCSFNYFCYMPFSQMNLVLVNTLERDPLHGIGFRGLFRVIK